MAEPAGPASGEQQVSKKLGRTSFRYDMMPWKLVFCKSKLKKVRSGGMTFEHCEALKDGLTIRIAEIPDAPEPGRIPEGCDHLHIEPKLSADQRNARDEEKWHALLMGTTRCKHGRVSREPCTKCPRGLAPDVTGKRVGTARDGESIIIPEYDDLADPK